MVATPPITLQDLPEEVSEGYARARASVDLLRSQMVKDLRRQPSTVQKLLAMHRRVGAERDSPEHALLVRAAKFAAEQVRQALRDLPADHKGRVAAYEAINDLARAAQFAEAAYLANSKAEVAP